MKQHNNLWNDVRGSALVEATILFPIIIMIFAGLVLLSMYLPTRASLQRATQYAATALATEQSDTWLRYDPDKMEYYWVDNKKDLSNVYVALFYSVAGKSQDSADSAEQIITNLENNGILYTSGDLEIECGITNYIVYKEISVTATRSIPTPVNLSFVNFPEEIPVTVTSTAVVQNGDEFVRNIDLAVDFVDYVKEKYNLNGIFDEVGSFFGAFNELLGI